MTVSCSWLYVRLREFRQKHPVIGCIAYQILKLPLILQLEILVYGYYLYAYLLCYKFLYIELSCSGQNQLYVLQIVAYLVIFHLILLLFFWCFVIILLTPTSRVPPEYHVDADTAKKLEELSERAKKEEPFDPMVSEDEIPEWLVKKREILDEFASKRGLKFAEVEDKKSLVLRYCNICQSLKPDRSRHCRSCGHCVLKFDHHCPWVGSCVSFNNYKFFLLYVFYGLILAIWVIGCEIQPLVYYCIYYDVANDPCYQETTKSSIEFASTTPIGGTTPALRLPNSTYYIQFIVGIFFQLLCGIFMANILRFHILSVNMNDTTADNFKRPIFRIRGGDYDLGKARNWRSIFGFDVPVYMWFIPTSDRIEEENGCEFEVVYPSETKTDHSNPSSIS